MMGCVDFGLGEINGVVLDAAREKAIERGIVIVGDEGCSDLEMVEEESL